MRRYAGTGHRTMWQNARVRFAVPRFANKYKAMSPSRPSNKHMPTAFLPLATAFESLAQRRVSGGIDAVAVQRALGLRSLFLADRLLVALGGGKRRFETPEEFITVAQKMMAAPAI